MNRDNVFEECRACLRGLGEEKRYQLFGPWPAASHSPGTLIAKDFAALVDIQISQTDCYPKSICVSCYERLKDTYLFIAMVKMNDKHLKKLSQMISGQSLNCDTSLWPQPIDINQQINTAIDNVEVEVKQEVMSENEDENTENMDTWEPRMDIKIEPEELIAPGPPIMNLNGSFTRLNLFDNWVTKKGSIIERTRQVLQDLIRSLPDVENVNTDILFYRVLHLCKKFHGIWKKQRCRAKVLRAHREWLNGLETYELTSATTSESVHEDALKNMPPTSSDQLDNGKGSDDCSSPRKWCFTRLHLFDMWRTCEGNNEHKTNHVYEVLLSSMKDAGPLDSASLHRRVDKICRTFHNYLKQFKTREQVMEARGDWLNAVEECNLFVIPVDKLTRVTSSEMKVDRTVLKPGKGTVSEGVLSNNEGREINKEHVNCTNDFNNCKEEYLDNTIKQEPVSSDEGNQDSDSFMECILCMKQFNSLTGLKAHVIAQHSYKTVKRKSSDEPEPVKKSNEGIHLCITCRKTFQTRTDLMVHGTSHDCHVCYVCRANFNSFEQLSRHKCPEHLQQNDAENPEPRKYSKSYSRLPQAVPSQTGQNKNMESTPELPLTIDENAPELKGLDKNSLADSIKKAEDIAFEEPMKHITSIEVSVESLDTSTDRSLQNKIKVIDKELIEPKMEIVKKPGLDKNLVDSIKKSVDILYDDAVKHNPAIEVSVERQNTSTGRYLQNEIKVIDKDLIEQKMDIPKKSGLDKNSLVDSIKKAVNLAYDDAVKNNPAVEVSMESLDTSTERYSQSKVNVINKDLINEQKMEIPEETELQDIFLENEPKELDEEPKIEHKIEIPEKLEFNNKTLENETMNEDPKIKQNIEIPEKSELQNKALEYEIIAMEMDNEFETEQNIEFPETTELNRSLENAIQIIDKDILHDSGQEQDKHKIAIELSIPNTEQPNRNMEVHLAINPIAEESVLDNKLNETENAEPSVSCDTKLVSVRKISDINSKMII